MQQGKEMEGNVRGYSYSIEPEPLQGSLSGCRGLSLPPGAAAATKRDLRSRSAAPVIGGGGNRQLWQEEDQQPLQRAMINHHVNPYHECPSLK